MVLEVFLSIVLSITLSVFILGNQDKVKWILCYIYLRLLHIFKKKRFDLYDCKRKGDEFEIGRPRPIEWKLDLPQDDHHTETCADEIFCYGVNSKLEYLIVRVSHESSLENEAWLYLKLASGKVYTLPQNVHFYRQPDETNTFSAGGLKISCILPMRKWRIFFNGLLREMPEEKNDQAKLVHVKFAFIWTASSNVYDYFDDLDPSLFATSLAAENWNQFLPPLNKLREVTDAYEQAGMLSGFVSVEEEQDREILLWGSRLRILASQEIGDYRTTQHVFGTLLDGSVFHIENLTLPGLLNNLQHGYMIQPSGKMFSINSCNLKKKYHEINNKSLQLIFSAGGNTYRLKAQLFEKFANFTSGKRWDGRLAPQYTTFTLNKCSGSGIVLAGKYRRWRTRKDTALYLPTYRGVCSSTPLVVKFIDPECALTNLTGGKGSSLARLTEASETNQSFVVPRGIVTTTSAFQEFMNVGHLVEMVSTLDAVSCGRMQGNKQELCDKTVATISNAYIPDSVCNAIERNLFQLFGNQVNKIKFAVRSSATGEDSEELSCAGQMDTFLGVQGLKEILSAIKKCWASQFTFVATEYKRRNGQLMLTPMAVVIQEMASCDVAGVMFTCDPVTSNPRIISITANYGLGESVVAATADPDTVMLKRQANGELIIDSTIIGNKKTKIVIDDSKSGTREEKVSDQEIQKCCISEETALRIGKIGIQIEEKFSSPRDIEWGMIDDQIYLLQSRPVTSIDVESEYELTHENDCILRREDEYVTNANTAEVIPGALSPLTISCIYPVCTACYMDYDWRIREGDKLPRCYYFMQMFPNFYWNVFINVLDGVYRYIEKDDSNFAKAFTFGLFGRDIGNEEIYRMAEERYPYSTSIINVWRQKITQLNNMFFSGRVLRKTQKKFMNAQIFLEKYDTAEELLEEIKRHWYRQPELMQRHLECTFGSTSWNLVLLSIVAKIRGGWNTKAFSDCAYLLSKCSKVESADVPAAIQNMAYDIAQNIDPVEFRNMKSQEALNWLQTTSSSSGAKFRDFLEKHGHRCYKEFDFYSPSWEQDPTILVETLQTCVESVKDISQDKGINDMDDILSKLDVHLDLKTRLTLKLVVPRCHTGIRQRENSKSLYIRYHNVMRRAFYYLADLMVREGRIPESKLLFFFTIDEIEQLLKTRSPRLLAKAARRQRLYPKLDSLRFPEMSRGLPRPVNMTPTIIETGSSFMMTGIPVSQGVVKGTACVANSLKEAAHIRPGDILIAYSTDIAWSPYFPMLSGVVTELGGLISHGAVVAREYGLPCVVAVQGATQAFKSGDLVLLDGTNGILKKLEKEEAPCDS